MIDDSADPFGDITTAEMSGELSSISAHVADVISQMAGTLDGLGANSDMNVEITYELDLEVSHNLEGLPAGFLHLYQQHFVGPQLVPRCESNVSRIPAGLDRFSSNSATAPSFGLNSSFCVCSQQLLTPLLSWCKNAVFATVSPACLPIS